MNSEINTIIFSKNRACQLELLLRSLNLPATVLYTFDPEFKAGYEKLIPMYPRVRFIKETNFKKDILNIIGKSKYTLFLTDDDVVVAPFSETFSEFIEFTKSPDVVSLSLGLSFKVAGHKWKWQEYRDNYRLRMWGYPMSVDSCVFRSEDIIPVIKAHDISNPNYLETYLNQNIPPRHYMMCCNSIKIINNSVNQVQNDFPAHTNGPTPLELESKFLSGERLSLLDLKERIKGAIHYRMKVEYKYESY
jgi:hypothetical protein